jgi:ADP-ribosylation factor protein 6
MRPNDVAQALDLDRIAKDHVWKVEPSCATSGEGKRRIHTDSHDLGWNTVTNMFLIGIFEGLSWLSQNVKVEKK